MEGYIFQILDGNIENKSIVLIDEIKREIKNSESKIENYCKLIVKVKPSMPIMDKLLKIFAKFDIEVDLKNVQYYDSYTAKIIDLTPLPYNSQLAKIKASKKPNFGVLDCLRKITTNLLKKISYNSYRNLKYKYSKLSAPDNDCELNTCVGDEKNDVLKTVEIHIFSLKCASCVSNVENVLKNINGVKEVSVNLIAKISYLTYDSNLTTTDLIMAKLNEIKHEAVIGSQNKREETTAYFKVNYIRSAENFHFFSITYRKKNIGIREIYKRLNEITRSAKITDYSEVYPSGFLPENWKKLFFVSFIFGFITMTLMMVGIIYPRISNQLLIPGLSYVNLILFICACIVQVFFKLMHKIFVGKTFYMSAYKSFFTGINMDFLICTATTVSFIYSCIILIIYMARKLNQSPHTFFETPAMLYMIVALGRWIEAKGRQHSIESIRNLIKTKKQLITATFYDKACKQFINKEIFCDLIEENDLIEVNIIDKILGVPRNEIAMKVTRTGEDCRIQQINHFVQKALSTKIQISDIVNTISRYFTPGICILSILTFIIWIICFNYIPDLDKDLGISSYIQFALQAAIAVLCVACPCALGLAIPLAIMISIGVGAKYGIFIKGGPSIQILFSIKKIVFDKTGTLTAGFPSVEYFKKNQEIDASDDYFLAIYNLVCNSNHIISCAIKKFIKESWIFKNEIIIQNFEEVLGIGLCGEYMNENITKFIVVGKEELMNLNHIFIPNSTLNEVSTICKQGATVVFVGIDSYMIGYFVIRDEIRSDAFYTIQNLKVQNIKPVMLSGDRMETSQYVANKLGIEEYYFNKIPEEKREIIEGLTQYGTKVAMVGDGINDIIAIAQSTVGISIGSGSDVAAETANVVLMSNKLHDLLNLICLSRYTMNTVTRNLVLSSIYNLMAVPIAGGSLKWVGIDIQPWIASIAMVVSSLSVTGSSMLLLLSVNFFIKISFNPPFDGINQPE
ncbi:hypothetical protein MXB_3772 [Myxobolus squamalis]|nr:hypothetical protein MXB_3772 [Myxobolus squamalis]